MIELLKTNLGRLRIIAFLEGASLLVLVFIGMPMKYFMDMHQVVKTMGPIHGGLFLLFIFNAVSVAIGNKWKASTVIMVLASSFIPFGTFYVDHKILSKTAA